MKQDGVILLNTDLLLGKGKNKDIYIHPDNPGRCIRINARSADEHLREMNYRKSRKYRHLPDSSFLAAYYGAVKTNLGEGFVFERISDYDGTASKTVEEIIRLEIKARGEGKSVKELLRTDKAVPEVAGALFRFRDIYFKEKFISYDLRPVNCMMQFDSPAEWRIRIIDGIGSPTLIPIVNYVDFLGAGHVRREWRKFIRRIEGSYPGFLTEEEIRDLTV